MMEPNPELLPKEACAPIPARPEPDWRRVGEIPIAEQGDQLVPTSLMPRPLLTYPAYARQGLAGAQHECLVRVEVGRRLQRAARSLPDGLCLVVLDAWRPWRVQTQLFETYREVLRRRHPEYSDDELLERTREFVSLPSTDPASPSPHLTGGAVDVTLCGPDGVWLDMGTAFDATVPASHTAYFEPGQAGDGQPDADLFRLRRRILFHAMRQAGFTNLPTEWWHFDYGNQLWAWHSGSKEAHYGPAPMGGSVPQGVMGLPEPRRNAALIPDRGS